MIEQTNTVRLDESKLWGITFNEIVTLAFAESVKQSAPCAFEFNGSELVVDSDAICKPLWEKHQQDSEARSKAWHESDEFKRQQAEAKERHRKLEEERNAVLAKASDKMTLRDADAWKSYVDANKDGYGGACVSYAERWACMMEVKIKEGCKVADCADSMSYAADVEGITGFMYGCAVSMLAKCWIHGEELRRWHNKKTQIKDEADKANEEGGVLNPAILTIN